MDAEWEDFDRLVNEYNLRKKKVLASPIFQRRHVEDLCDISAGKDDDRQQTAFYPCPPPTEAVYDYISNNAAVSVILNLFHEFLSEIKTCFAHRDKFAYF